MAIPNLPAAPISADPANDVDPRAAGNPDPGGGEFLGGMNQGGCQPGVGVNTGGKNPKIQDWPRITIDPLKYDRIGWGGDSVVTGQEDADVPNALAVEYVADDFNDTFAFALADTQAVTGVAFDTITGAVNMGTETVEIGDWAWGVVPAV